MGCGNNEGRNTKVSKHKSMDAICCLLHHVTALAGHSQKRVITFTEVELRGDCGFYTFIFLISWKRSSSCCSLWAIEGSMFGAWTSSFHILIVYQKINDNTKDFSFLNSFILEFCPDFLFSVRSDCLPLLLFSVSVPVRW